MLLLVGDNKKYISISSMNEVKEEKLRAIYGIIIEE
jgi:hypothetical protein